MIQSINNIIKNYDIEGEILLYRDENHRKKGMLQFLKDNFNIGKDQVICTYSDGAFGLWTARIFNDNQVITCFPILSPDYGELMEATKNLILISGIKNLSNWKEYYEGKGYFIINQFEDNLVKDYYKNYFLTVVNAVKDYHIDAFCDCGHSCATIAGFIEADLVDWQFILGVNTLGKREKVHHLMPLKDKVIQYTTKKFDTLKLGKEIEAAYPEFGNVYEATRSISAAMSYLKDNPGKTVLIYVGDSFEKEGTKFGQDTII